MHVLGINCLATPKDVVWNSQSQNSSESMPCGGGSIGMNVWVEHGDIYFYLSRSGSFDENNTLLKQGRFRLRLSPSLNSKGFEQRLIVRDGYVRISDGESTIDLWVDVFRPVVHIAINSKISIQAECNYENWRYRDRIILQKESFQTSYKFGVPSGCLTHKDEVFLDGKDLVFYHHNPDSTIFDATVLQQQLKDYRNQLNNPLSNRIFGGKLVSKDLFFRDTYQGIYNGVDFKGWKFVSAGKSREFHLQIILAECQGSYKEWNTRLLDTQNQIHTVDDRGMTIDWWRLWWNRSFIEGEGECAEMTRNYTLFRYMLGCNAHGQWPTKFNGGLFCFDPIFVDSTYAFTPDYRKWGGGTHTAQNQRLVYWPMLKSGDYDALKTQLDFYLYILRNAECRSKVYWNHGGAAFTEQIENFGLPQFDEYGKKRPVGFDPGLEYNAWLEYTWDTVLEFCQMALDAENYGGVDIERYIPWIESSLEFFDQHYRYIAQKLGRKQLDENNKLIIYPGSGAETFKMAYNPSATSAGLHVVTQSLLSYMNRHHYDSTRIEKIRSMLDEWPDIAFRYIDGHRVIAPAVAWARVNNTEPSMLYPVFPWRVYGVGRDDLQVARDTWVLDPYVKKFNGYVGWEQANIWAADLGLTDEALYWNSKKLASGPYRFPAFWGPGHDWSPDHNWGGSGMIGLQEMLLQEANNKIYLLPAWPKSWNIHFKLHCSNKTTVELEWRDGKVKSLIVFPESRKKDIVFQ